MTESFDLIKLLNLEQLEYLGEINPNWLSNKLSIDADRFHHSDMKYPSLVPLKLLNPDNTHSSLMKDANDSTTSWTSSMATPLLSPIKLYDFSKSFSSESAFGINNCKSETASSSLKKNVRKLRRRKMQRKVLFSSPIASVISIEDSRNPEFIFSPNQSNNIEKNFITLAGSDVTGLNDNIEQLNIDSNEYSNCIINDSIFRLNNLAGECDDSMNCGESINLNSIESKYIHFGLDVEDQSDDEEKYSIKDLEKMAVISGSQVESTRIVESTNVVEDKTNKIVTKQTDSFEVKSNNDRQTNNFDVTSNNDKQKSKFDVTSNNDGQTKNFDVTSNCEDCKSNLSCLVENKAMVVSGKDQIERIQLNDVNISILSSDVSTNYNDSSLMGEHFVNR